jgi:uncharacterized protein YjbI with pentapeptide repeats
MPSFVDHLIKLGVDPLIQLVFVAGAAILLAAWWLWWRLPKRQVDRLSLKIRDAKARADVEDSFRKTITQLLGGAAVLIGAGFAYLQFSQQQRQFSQQQQASHELLISNQVSKGFEQLGNDKSTVVRLGGIYALEGVMNASEQYRRPVLEALCAFVRDNTRSKVKNDQPPATDVQAALTVIARRSSSESDVVDLARAHINSANLFGAKNLMDANLAGADLSGADLREAHLSKANLREAHLAGADLSGADLRKADLSGAQLIDANLSKANLTRANLSYANLTRAHLSKADLSGAQLIQADLSGTYLTLANLIDAHLAGADLSKADLSGADLREADLSEAHLSKANLIDANLAGADLNRADLSEAHLREAHLREAHLHRADLNSADLSGADLSAAELTGATISQAQLDEACGAEAKLPPGLTLKPCASPNPPPDVRPPSAPGTGPRTNR